MIEHLLMSLFPFLVIAAAISDFFTMKIPNWLNLLIAGLMLPMALIAGMPGDQFVWSLAAGALMLVAGFGLFAANAIGGGDAKLFAAAALWIGWNQLLPFALYTALAGGALAIAMKTWQLVRIEHEVKDVACSSGSSAPISTCLTPWPSPPARSCPTPPPSGCNTCHSVGCRQFYQIAPASVNPNLTIRRQV